MINLKILLLFLFIQFTCSNSCPPSVVDYSHDFAINGDFESPDTNGGHVKNQVLPGWIADTMELGRGSIYNSNWGSNTQVIEMDVDENENYTKVETLTEGQYFFSFQYACRSGNLASSGLDVYWNYNLIFSTIGTSIGNLNVYTKSFILDAVEG